MIAAKICGYLSGSHPFLNIPFYTKTLAVKQRNYMKNRRSVFIIFMISSLCRSVLGQPVYYTTANAHSHNDYEQALPFYNAYARHFGSIEADVWAVDGTLYVAHNRDQITEKRTLHKLYLDPLISRLKVNDRKAYDNGQPLQWLIDLKSSYREVMPLLNMMLQPYRKYFDCALNPDAVRIVISGSMPPPDSLHVYDPIFTFDGRLGYQYPKGDFQRVTLVSCQLYNVV